MFTFVWNYTDKESIQKSITVFSLITAHNHCKHKSQEIIVFRLQPVYFFSTLWHMLCNSNEYPQHMPL